ncbi:restriction endonuclease subunit S [Catenibacterium mitsuokai]|uniref:restriction endonuclease subunit S n=1 Tax=Catenibacterium mitsuokai TaxID=100886 RepID=UPI00319D89C4
MEYKKLGDIATYINGYAFKPEQRGSEGLPIIRIQDLTGNAYDLGYYNGDYPKKVELNDGDVLISWSASLGVYLWNRGKALLNQHIFKVVFDKVEIDKFYFMYAVEYNLDKMSLKTHGATMKHITKKDFDNVVIPYPDLDYQKEVAYRLTSLKGIIENYKKQLDLLDELVKARFMEMFGDPVLNEKSWRVIKLGKLCSKICSGNTPKGGSDNYTKEGIMFFRSQNVWKNRLELDDIVYIDEATHEKMKETSLNYGDILITKTGRINTENSSLGRSALFLGKNDSANINGHVYLVRINSELVNRHFVLQILISPQYRDLIRRVCVGGIDKRQLNQNHIYDFPIIIPPLELQNQFASFVEEIDKSRLLSNHSLFLIKSIIF